MNEPFEDPLAAARCTGCLLVLAIWGALAFIVVILCCMRQI